VTLPRARSTSSALDLPTHIGNDHATEENRKGTDIEPHERDRHRAEHPERRSQFGGQAEVEPEAETAEDRNIGSGGPYR
jgi:hypothetical protein